MSTILSTLNDFQLPAELEPYKAYWPVLLSGAVVLGVRNLFAVPRELRHLPKVSVIRTLWSFIRGEVEDVRIKKLLLPYANKGEPAVLVYALGRWIVHVLDRKIAKDLSADIVTYPKEVPPDGLLLWRFVGYQNVILSNGEAWKRHHKVVKTALDRNVPIGEFSTLAKKLFVQMGNGGLLHWNDLTMRYTLDAVGTTAIGHDFDAINNHDSPFVKKYNHVMESIANPAYLAIDELVAMFQGILTFKKENPGNDMLTYMLEDKNMNDTEYRDNMVVFFIAGHDTTAGAMSSLSYYMAMKPEIQQRAREEVRAAMAKNTTNGEPTMAELAQMPYLQACIRESLRVNTPITYMVPRAAMKDAVFTGSNGKEAFIPAGSSIITNITAIHYKEDYWSNPTEFIPERFMNLSESQEKEYDATQWLPFALGSRMCPARNFAMYEQRVLAAMLLNEWEWTIPSDSEHIAGIKNGFSPFALSLPQNLYLNFKPARK
ncbi:cytochrome P450 [Roridomyces roridus]|uniref:Cytochrome P450 n=1 Tax=Roridomyces roridus TaxID=1738132 RepID=A0AAD7BHQ1_9AGAR|nr:cytochrome P450 [Roridomyces roridus]